MEEETNGERGASEEKGGGGNKKWCQEGKEMKKREEKWTFSPWRIFPFFPNCFAAKAYQSQTWFTRNEKCKCHSLFIFTPSLIVILKLFTFKQI